jgi:hypothetical protein
MDDAEASSELLPGVVVESGPEPSSESGFAPPSGAAPDDSAAGEEHPLATHPAAATASPTKILEKCIAAPACARRVPLLSADAGRRAGGSRAHATPVAGCGLRRATGAPRSASRHDIARETGRATKNIQLTQPLAPPPKSERRARPDAGLALQGCAA